jgi:hypothetical protein
MDHARAMIINVDAEGGRTSHEIHSEVPPNHQTGVADGEHLTIVNQNNANNVREHEMHAYVKKIIQLLHNATEIVIYGPGNAKFELKKGIEHEKSIAHAIKACETTDKLTEEELMAHIKKAFNLA